MNELIELRHAFHRIPELAGEEHETARLIRAELARLDGLEVLPPFLGTDVVALLRGARPGRNILLRADIDALAIEEATGLPYRSIHPGRMHACGHDGHIAMLIGAARELVRRRAELAGTVRLVFQPGEEVRAMARELIAAGGIDDPAPDCVAALHNWPGYEVGAFAGRAGAMMASAAHFYVTVKGRGGHSSAPQQTVDPVLIGAAVVQALQSIVSRNIDPQDAGVVSVCCFHAGNASNVIPETAQLDGTCRALSAANAALLKKRFYEIVENTCAAMGGSCTIRYEEKYPPTVNDPAWFELARRVAEQVAGEGMFIEEPRSNMAAEDFACYLAKAPGVYLRIGTGCDQPGLHRDTYDFADGALANGVAYLTRFALEAARCR